MNRITGAILGALLMLAPLGAQAADLVVWWEEGYYPEEDEAVREIVAAFEQESGKQVELVFYPAGGAPRQAQRGAGGRPAARLRVRHTHCQLHPEWAFDDRLVDLTDTVGHFSDLFDPDALAWYVLLNQKTGQRALYGLPMGRTTNHVHVWKSLLEQAGFTLEDIPKEWDAFWSFWCDQVQPAVRQATGPRRHLGRRPIMSGEASDTQISVLPVPGRLRGALRDPRRPARHRRSGGPAQADQGDRRYTAVYRKGCTPPDSVDLGHQYRQQQGFLAQAVVMTPNQSLSIPNALKRERPDDYYKNTATIEWPLGPDGEAFPIEATFYAAVVFKDGGNVADRQGVRPLPRGRGLACPLSRLRRRALAAADAEAARGAVLARPERPAPHGRGDADRVAAHAIRLHQVSGDWRYDLVWQELVWAKAIHRVAAEGISPEQAVDEAIARIKQILSE